MAQSLAGVAHVADLGVCKVKLSSLRWIVGAQLHATVAGTEIPRPP